MLEALDHWPVNVALLGKGNTVSHEAHARAAARPAPAGSSCTRTGAPRPAAIDACLRVADETGRAGRDPHRHAERGRATSRSTLAAIAGRSIHTYHTEGAGGGHAPDIITVAVAPQRAAVVDQPDPAAHASTRSTSTSTC